ncbi:hypothetical protein LX32DRAFT_302975 [Colletotrichum zoysiae]|uniref:Uncharacterized protein n=1 Tax=Colletotrichum zoysiae TaxID=1216348 RepID=A0AAD9HMC2_9PEZI|nr:hypothetical protein LX32DRAFT_302975 [Colletotrichum zoysiae]
MYTILCLGGPIHIGQGTAAGWPWLGRLFGACWVPSGFALPKLTPFREALSDIGTYRDREAGAGATKMDLDSTGQRSGVGGEWHEPAKKGKRGPVPKTGRWES